MTETTQYDCSAFEVTFDCRNCGAQFERRYTDRTRVTISSTDRATVRNVDCEEFGVCDCCWRIECPVCGLEKYLTIDDRQPIEDVDTNE